MTRLMEAAIQRAYGPVDRLAIATVERPVPGPGDVVIEVRAAALSPGDRAMIIGVPYVNRLAASGLRHPKHPIPGFDAAGVVVEAGSAVTRFEVGDHVFGNAPGSLAEYAIIGAGGGVGCYALQIAKVGGARVTAVCSTRMLEAVRALGADDVVDYATGDLADARRKYDVIIDTAGVTPLRRLREALTQRGRLVVIGADHHHRVTGGLGRWIRAALWSPFVTQQLRPFVAQPLTAEHLAELTRFGLHGSLDPCVARTFPFEEVATAMAYLDHRDKPGKVVVTRAQ